MNIEQIYLQATIVARNNKQIVGKKQNFYITLEQLMDILKLEELVND